MDIKLIYELVAVVVLYLFLPITAATYLLFRQRRRTLIV